MKYGYPDHRIAELVAAPKCLREGDRLEVAKSGDKGGTFDANLDLLDGPFADLRYLGKAHDFRVVEGFESSLLLGAQRVRGVGHHRVGRRRFYKDRIPPGWHQNIINPNLPTTHEDYNRHEPLPNFRPLDFKDFIRKTAALWHIELDWEQELV
jgi:hypothetical protein